MIDELMTEENLAAQLERARQENAELQQQRTDDAKKLRVLQEQALILDAVNKLPDWQNVKAAAQLLSSNLKLDEAGKLSAYGDAGEPLLGPFGRLSADEFIADFRQQNTWLVRDSGAASGSNQHDNGVPLATLFGPKSKGSIANKLAMENPAEYRRLKVLAKEQGLI